MKPSCQQVSQLVSDSHERRLTLRERLLLRLHLLMCSLCKAYERDIRLLKSVCGLLQKEQIRVDVCMSAEEHERIRQALLRSSAGGSRRKKTDLPHKFAPGILLSPRNRDKGM